MLKRFQRKCDSIPISILHFIASQGGREPGCHLRLNSKDVSRRHCALVFRDGKLFLVTGSPGGRTIINTTLHVVLNSIDFGMDVRQAVSAPREDFEWMPDSVSFERPDSSDVGRKAAMDSISRSLTAMGHRIRLVRRWGDAHSIRYDAATKTASGANDSRSPDSKVSKP